ncbi:MAG: hypothetical protein GY856_50275, partial [bacterium]|nr:hypothetical protein [bacterium]
MVKNKPPAPGPLAPKRPYVLPLAISLVSLVLVALILAMGGLNYRALQRNLVELVVKDAVAISHRFDRIVYYEYDALTAPSRHHHGDRRGSRRENAQRFLRSLLEELTETAVEAGRQAAGDNEMRDWLEREGISLVAVFDKAGTLLFETGATPEDLRRRIQPVVAGRTTPVTNLL